MIDLYEILIILPAKSYTLSLATISVQRIYKSIQIQKRQNRRTCSFL